MFRVICSQRRCNRVEPVNLSVFRERLFEGLDSGLEEVVLSCAAVILVGPVSAVIDPQVRSIVVGSGTVDGAVSSPIGEQHLEGLTVPGLGYSRLRDGVGEGIDEDP